MGGHDRQSDASETAPGVSVVVVAWNSRNELPTALESLLPIGEIEHEVVVVDNASADGSADLVESRFPSVRVIRNAENRGFAAGVNVGIRATHLPFVLLLNPDTEVRPGAVSSLVEHLRRNPAVGIVGPRVLNPDGTIQGSRFRYPSLTHLALAATYLYQLFPGSSLLNRERFGNEQASAPVSSEVISGCCFLVRRSLLDEIGCLDESFFMYAEETDLCYRAGRAGWRVEYVPAAVIVHEGGASSRLDRRRNFLEFRRSILRFFYKHRGRVAAETARLLLMLFLLLRIPYWGARCVLRPDGRSDSASQLGNLLAGLWFLASPLPRLLAKDRFGR